MFPSSVDSSMKVFLSPLPGLSPGSSHSQAYPALQLMSSDRYPNGYAWQLNIAKQQIRKNEAFRKFQNFLVYETDAGNISRQEAVSMIPPLLLDILPHHYVS
jgi:16S rRNA C967 or C1407 C5-methylase (RsmB/RsmF family)